MERSGHNVFQGWEKGLEREEKKCRYQPQFSMYLYQKVVGKVMGECRLTYLRDACPRGLVGEVALRKVNAGV